MNTKNAKKGLSKFDVLNLVIGSIIGWGSFILPGTFFLPKAGVLSTVIGLGLGGFFIAIIQKAYQVMLARHVAEPVLFEHDTAQCDRIRFDFAQNFRKRGVVETPVYDRRNGRVRFGYRYRVGAHYRFYACQFARSVAERPHSKHHEHVSCRHRRFSLFYHPR